MCTSVVIHIKKKNIPVSVKNECSYDAGGFRQKMVKIQKIG